MHSMKSEARLMNSAKLKRMGIEGKTENKMYGAEAMPPMVSSSKQPGGKPGKKRFATGGAVLGEDDEMGGAPAPRRLDKAKRGKGGSTVNIVIAPQGGGAPPPPAGPQPGMVAPPPPPPPQQPPGIPPQALAALAGAAGGKPPGLKTGGRAPFKRGGAVKRNAGGAVSDKEAALTRKVPTLSERITSAVAKPGSDIITQKDITSATEAAGTMPSTDTGKPGAILGNLPAGDGAGSGEGGNGRNGMKRGGKACRATGGKVYDAGAGSGEGRLEKERAYGKNARP